MGQSSRISSMAGPAKWAAVGALTTAAAGGALWGFWREPAPQVSALPPAPVVLPPAPAKEPVLLSQVPERPKEAEPAAPPEVVPQFVESTKPQVVSPKLVGPPLPVSPAPADTKPDAMPTKPDAPASPATGPTPSPTPAPKPDSGPAPKADPKPASKLINVNTATAAELELLPDIGPSLAKRIIEYRERHGRFEKLADLDKVSGIGPKTLEKLKDRVSFR